MITKPLRIASFRAARVPGAYRWFHTLYPGWCLPLWENTGTALEDIGSLGAPAAFAGAAPPTWVADALGVGVGFGGVSARCDMVTPTGFGALMANGPFTAYAVVRPDAVGTLRVVLGDHDVAGNNRSIEFRQAASNQWGPFAGAGGAIHGFNDTATAVAAGTLAVLVTTFSATALHHTLTMYINGGSEGTPYDFGSADLDNGVALTVGRAGAQDTRYFSGTMLMLGGQQGKWTDAQIAQFSADPFQVLVQLGRRRNARRLFAMPRTSTTKTVRIAAGGDGLSTPVRLQDYRLAAIQIPGSWVAAYITFRGRSKPPEARTQVVPTGVVAGIAVDANPEDIQMTSAPTIQIRGAPAVTPAKTDPIDISALLSAAATIGTSKYGVLWVFEDGLGVVSVEVDKTTADHTSQIMALAQYAKPTRPLPPVADTVPIGAVHVLEGGSGPFTWGTDSITAETETYYDFFGLPEMLVRVASLALDAGAATFTYGAGVIRLGTGTRVAITGKANVTIAGSNVAAGKVGAWLLYALADDVEYALPFGNAYATLADAKAAVAARTKNPMLACFGVMYVVNGTAGNFQPGTTFLDAASIATTFEIVGPEYENLYDDAGTELTVTAAAGRLIELAGSLSDDIRGPLYLQIRSGTSGTPVNQTASPDIDLMLVPV
jgi:hypothetical protein